MDLVEITGYGIDLLTVRSSDSQFRKLLAKCYELYFNQHEIDYNTQFVKFDFIDTYTDDVEMLVYMYKFNDKYLYDALAQFSLHMGYPLSHETLIELVKQAHKIDNIAIKDLTINDLL